MNYWAALKADIYRFYGSFSWFLLFNGFLKARTLRPIITMRICQLLANSNCVSRFLLPFAIILHRIACHGAAIDLDWHTAIGYGILIDHGFGLVINARATIGNNVTLFHGVTIGQRDRINKKGERETVYPIIEDEVWIGPHAIIVGGITIGRGSRIAGGAFITEDVPPYSVVSGNPAKTVKENCTPDVINPSPFN